MAQIDTEALVYTVHRLCSMLAWKQPYKVVGVWGPPLGNRTVALIRVPSGRIVRTETAAGFADVPFAVKRLLAPQDFTRILVFLLEGDNLSGVRWTLTWVGAAPVCPVRSR